MEAKSGMTLGAPRREERVEHMALHVLRNAASIVGERDLDLIGAEPVRLDQHLSARSLEAVGDGVEDEVGQYLPVGARVAVECDVGGDLKRERPFGFPNAGPHTGHDLLGCKLQVEVAAIGTAAIDGNLLERLNELTRALK